MGQPCLLGDFSHADPVYARLRNSRLAACKRATRFSAAFSLETRIHELHSFVCLFFF